MWPISLSFSLSLFSLSLSPPVCVLWTACLLICRYHWSLSLSLSVTLSETPPLPPPPPVPSSTPPVFFLFFFYYSFPSFIGWQPHMETAHWAGLTLECCSKLCSMCAWHVSWRCPTDTHFMLMSCRSSRINRGEMRGGGERSHSCHVSLTLCSCFCVCTAAITLSCRLNDEDGRASIDIQ